MHFILLWQNTTDWVIHIEQRSVIYSSEDLEVKVKEFVCGEGVTVLPYRVGRYRTRKCTLEETDEHFFLSRS